MKPENDLTTRECSVSVIVPAYNEAIVLPVFHRRLVSVLETLSCEFEVIYVDDGSSDATPDILQQFHIQNSVIGIVRLSRNFGKEPAMSAGLRLAKGECVIVIDADLQDPPELIPSMIDAWHHGADVVNMRRRSRKGETWLKKASAHAFYHVINRLSETSMPENVGDFRLLSRRAVDALNKLQEQNRYMKGLFSWIGFGQVTLDYDRDARAAGKSKWRYWQLWNFALEGITGFSTAPLKVATYVGFVSATSAFVYAAYFLIKALMISDPVSGFPTLIVTILFFAGIQLMALGVIGEYLGRLFIESKRRPLYIIEDYQSPATSAGPYANSHQEVVR